MRIRRDRLLVPALAVLAFGLALAQRPGLASSDTKIDLHVDPVGFLGDAASAWSSTGDLGHVQGGQYGGYVFPMGPFFALGHLLGAAPWLVQRLWLGLVLTLAAWGAVRLMHELRGPRALTGLLFVLNPYVVVFTARTSITLLGYAALPWLLVCTLRGARQPGWRWPAAFALVVTASGGGVNAAVTAWVLLGPAVLGLYLLWTREVAPRELLAFTWRALLATALASAWWVLPLLVQSRYGVDFLRFTEQPGTIWSTTSLPESLRLMGYWISYLGVGYGGALRPYFGGGGVLLFALPVVLAGLLVPALALTGFATTRRHPYAPFALALVLVGLIVMTAGFPEGTPLRRASNFTYNHVVAVQFLRTTYKAGPLVGLGVAILAGLVGTRARAIPFVVLALVACWPLMRGRALDDQLLWNHVPSTWHAAAAHVDDTVKDGRAVVLPGQLYAYYNWGGTIDPILPAIAAKPVATRNAVGYADPRATDLLWTVDALVQQRRALPDQLDPLLDLLGARTVLQAADDDRSRSGAAPAAEAADMLAPLGRPDAAYGPTRPRPRAAGTLGAPVELPAIRAWDRPRASGLVRVEPADPSLVVDGSAEGLATLETPLRGLAYAADLAPAAIRRAGTVAITDSNRRRVLVPSRLAQNAGPVLAADEEPSVDAEVLDPFPQRGSDAQTVAVYGGGIGGVSAPSSPGFPQFPENRPFAALDGDPGTHWQADRALTADRHTLTVRFPKPRDIPWLRVLPYDDRHARVVAVDVGGRRYATKPGWNQLGVDLHGVSALSVHLDVDAAKGKTAGIRELAIPGVHATEALRPPVVAERALAPGFGGTLIYAFQRTTGDDPFRRDPRHGPSSAGLVRDRGDAERGLERVFTLPAMRRWALDGWATITPDAPDSALDALVGLKRIFNSSGRFEGRPLNRASSAFDGTPTPWIGSWQDGQNAWLEWDHPATISSLRLDPVPGVRRPTLVRVSADGRASPPLAVGADGTVRLPAALSGRHFRLEILRAAFAPGTPGVQRQRRAVGIAEIHGVAPVHVPRQGRLGFHCNRFTVEVGGRLTRMAVDATIADLDAGRPLRAAACAKFTLPAGPTRLSAPAGTFAPYILRLRSDGRRTEARSGRVLSAGTAHRNGSRTGVRLALDAPARLILAESFTRGRRASCDGHDLGPPQPGDGYGTAWRVPRGCRDVEITFAPNRLISVGYVVSAVTALVLLLLLLRGRAASAPAPVPRPEVPPRRLSARRAALLAVPAALAFGFVFAARGVPLFWLGVFLVLWRGIGARELALAGGALLAIAVPVLTLVIRPENRGGYNPEYAIDRIAVHWVAVAGIALFFLALSRAMARPDRARAAPPSAVAQPRSAA